MCVGRSVGATRVGAEEGTPDATTPWTAEGENEARWGVWEGRCDDDGASVVGMGTSAGACDGTDEASVVGGRDPNKAVVGACDTVGDTVGADVSDTVGVDVGAGVWAMDGMDEGCVVGAVVRVGACESAAAAVGVVGALVGSALAVGPADGANETVGDMVGDDVGTMVGELVGEDVCAILGIADTK